MATSTEDKTTLAAKLGLQLLGSLQEQRRNAQPNIPFQFSVSSPKFSMQASPRDTKTDMLESTIKGLEELKKAREKSLKAQQLEQDIEKQLQLGQTPSYGGIPISSIKKDAEGGMVVEAEKPKLGLLDILTAQAGGGGSNAVNTQGIAQAVAQLTGQQPPSAGQTQTTNQPVTATTPGAVQLPSGKYGVPQQGMAVKGANIGGVNITNLDTETAIKRIQNLTPEKASDSEKKSLADIVNSVTSMDDLMSFIQNNKSVLEDKLGPLNPDNFPGGVGQFLRRIKGDVTLSTLALSAETTFQQVRSAITGAQASAKELEILRPLTPDLRDPLPVFVAKVLAFKSAAARAFNNKLNVLEAAGTEVTDLRKLMKETLAITESEYRIQLIENGVDPEEATRIARTFAKNAKEEAGKVNPSETSEKGLSQDELKSLTSF